MSLSVQNDFHFLSIGAGSKVLIDLEQFGLSNCKDIKCVSKACSSLLHNQVELTWELIKVVYYFIINKKIDEQKHYSVALKNIKNLNTFRYDRVKEVLNKNKYNSLQLTGSENVDSDIDITFLMPLNDIDPYQELVSKFEEAFNFTNSTKLTFEIIEKVFDVNLYLANFIINCDIKPNLQDQICESIKGPCTHHCTINEPEFRSMNVKYNNITINLLVTPKVLYRLSEMFNYDDNGGKSNDYVTQVKNEYKFPATALDYTNIVDQIKLLIGNNNSITNKDKLKSLDNLLFQAALSAKDQYYSKWTFLNIVLKKHLEQPQQKIDAIWDNIGMLYHMLTQNECQEIFWVRKTFKYLHRILQLLWSKVNDTEPIINLINQARINYENTSNAVHIKYLTDLNIFPKEDLKISFLTPLLQKFTSENGEIQQNKIDIFTKIFTYTFMNSPFLKVIEQDTKGGTSFLKTKQSIQINKAKRCIYLTPGSRIRYVKWNKQFVTVKSLKKRFST
jgi:hypothetical protein